MPFPKQKAPEEQTALDRSVLHILLYHRGKANAIDRWKLVEQVFGEPVPAVQRNDDNIQDRDIRYCVGRLREGGHLICDLGDGNGRWIAANKEEFWEFFKYFVAPIRSRASVARALKKAAQVQFADLMQIDMFDLDELEASYG